MESLKLHEKDVAVMKQFYQQELEKTMKHLQHIKSVLESLGDKSTQIQISLKGSSKNVSIQSVDGTGTKRGPGRPRKTENASASIKAPKGRGKKRGPESIWGTFILDRLKDSDRPMTYQQLVDAALTRFNLAENKRKATSDAIINAAFRLRKNAKRIDTFSAGQREKHVALKAWFDSPGKINAAYLDKAKMDLKPKAVKAAKPAKVKVAKVAPVKRGKVGRPAKVKATKPSVAVSTEPKKRGRKPNPKLQKLKELIRQAKSESSARVRKTIEAKATAPKKVVKNVAKKVATAAPKAKTTTKKAAVAKKSK